MEAEQAALRLLRVAHDLETMRLYVNSAGAADWARKVSPLLAKVTREVQEVAEGVVG